MSSRWMIAWPGASTCRTARTRSPGSRASPTVPGVGYVQESAAINTHQGFSITAEIERSGPADGVLAAMGGKTSGWSLYVKDGRPIFYYNFFSLAGYRAESSAAPAGGQEHGPRRVRSRGEGLWQTRGGETVREWTGDGEGSRREDGSGRLQRRRVRCRRRQHLAGQSGLQVAVRVRRHHSRRHHRPGEIAACRAARELKQGTQRSFRLPEIRTMNRIVLAAFAALCTAAPAQAQTLSAEDLARRTVETARRRGRDLGHASGQFRPHVPADAGARRQAQPDRLLVAACSTGKTRRSRPIPT